MAMAVHSNNHRSGILSQTLASSPSVKWILPARLRSPLHKDVVFVSSTSIQLREFKDDGLLTEVSARLELGVTVLAAKVISAKEHTISLEDAILENGRDEVRFTVRGLPCPDSQPPQILVLSLASGELMYVYAKESAVGMVRFVYAKRRLIGGFSSFEKYGKHLAVDPESRALAVAPWKGSFSIMSLKDVDETKKEIDNYNPRDSASIAPIKEQRSVEVDGLILKMSFLRSTSLEPEKAILLLIVVNSGCSRLLMYRWDTRQPLHTMKPMRCSGQQLSVDNDFPLLLIPFQTISAFAIVTQGKLVCYDDITSDQLVRTEIKWSPKPSQNSDIWVQWAKAVRHKKHEESMEDVFLVREDGHLITFVVNNTTSARFGTCYQSGELGIRVDTAVCTLQSPPTMGGDILIAAGDMTEGGVFHLPSKLSLSRLQTIPNWSPLHDMVILDEKTSQKIGQAKPSTYVTAGRPRERGSLMQLNYGFEALISWTIEYPDASSIDQLWAMNGISNNHLLLVVSHHEHTTALVFEPDSEDLMILEADSFPGLNFFARTLAMAKVFNQFLLQVTDQSVNVISPTPGESLLLTTEPGSHNLCADIDHASGLFVVAKRASMSIAMTIGIVVTSPDGKPEMSFAERTETVNFVPVAVSLTSLVGTVFCFTVSQEGILYIYSVEPETGLREQLKHDLKDLGVSQQVEFVSSLSILALPGSRHALVLCGLKSGQVIFSRLTIPNQGTTQIEIQNERIELLGKTAVSIKREQSTDLSTSAHAVLLCGSNIRRISLFGGQSGLEYNADTLWITSKDNDPLLRHQAAAFDRIPPLSLQQGEDPSNMFVFASGQDIFMCVCSGRKTVSRCIQSADGPRKLAFSNCVKKFVITLNSQQGNVASNGTTTSPKLRPPFLQIVDPLEPYGSVKRPPFPCGDSGDRVRALLEWRPTDGKNHFDMMVLGIDGKSGGRLEYVTGARLGQENATPKFKKLFNFQDRPIRAVSTFGLSSLAVCTGRELQILRLDLHTRKVDIEANWELPSPATSVATQGSTIYVATALHSLIVLRYEEQKLRVLDTAKWAGTARHVVPFTDGSVLANLVSDHGSKILGYTNQMHEGAQPTFEALLSRSIDHLSSFKQITVSDGRDRFQGCTVDGTVYLFTTLSLEETKLLKFLEQLAQPYHSPRMRKLGAKAEKAAILGRFNAGAFRPSDGGASHVQGDLLQSMLEPGQFYIQNLLAPKVKQEDEMDLDERDDYKELELLARPVVAPSPPTVETVVLWLRRLLEMPSF